MKTAIYIEDGRTQLVLTPETKTDKAVLDTLQNGGSQPAFTCYRGEFYGQGGWTRHGSGAFTTFEKESERSLIFVVDATPVAP